MLDLRHARQEVILEACAGAHAGLRGRRRSLIGNIQGRGQEAGPRFPSGRANHERDWLEGAALRPETANRPGALASSPRRAEPILLHGTGEAEILPELVGFPGDQSTRRAASQFAGWSIFHFDLPVLIIRSPHPGGRACRIPFVWDATSMRRGSSTWRSNG